MNIANGVRLSSANPMRQYGAPSAGSQHATARSTTGSRLNRWTAPGADPKSGFPDGYRNPYAWLLPMKPGALAARNRIRGAGALSAAGAMGKNATATLSGSGTLSGTGGLIVSAAATLAGTGGLTGSLVGILDAAATMTGSGSLAGAMTAYGSLAATVAGLGSLDAVASAVGHMTATISPFSALSPQALAAAVWSANAVDSNVAGSMGEKVNDAGSASNPWTEVIEGSFTAAELLRIIAAALAGELSGAGSTTITIVGVDQATDRIVASVDSTGNRLAVTLDGSG